MPSHLLNISFSCLTSHIFLVNYAVSLLMISFWCLTSHIFHVNYAVSFINYIFQVSDITYFPGKLCRLICQISLSAVCHHIFSWLIMLSYILINFFRCLTSHIFLVNYAVSFINYLFLVSDITYFPGKLCSHLLIISFSCLTSHIFLAIYAVSFINYLFQLSDFTYFPGKLCSLIY